VARPAKIRFASARVVNAVANAFLEATLKLQWREHFALGGGEQGCYAGAGVLAQRLGLSRDAIERGRRTLAELGLLRIEANGPGKSSSYFVTLPPDCEPATDRPSANQVAELAARLEAHIRGVRSGGMDAATASSEVAASVHSGNRTDAARVAAPLRLSGGMVAATLAALVPPVSTEKRAESGGTDAAMTSPRMEVAWREPGELQVGDRARAVDENLEEYQDGPRMRLRRRRAQP